ncbi:cbb3-type cytochrome c oxidase subunit 3 [Mesobaculum littorinae]|uniref:Cbb3-type cytochrome c oxidase subunit 3 n=1 Tax=Mesobaculum littorinae TaxID=2486419 RepID=A0A438ADB9_9RHOB|nr:cbb3-type cytochrome c oxidase subunit 3 [Mesobaculum littorinae]RVV96696.1 cbb3-type cytochrome c oxidase subunit 3 [Mesobaculum littorinae]
MDYHILREIADSWVLLALTLFFIGCIGWALRPGSRAIHDDASTMVFRNEKAPAQPAAHEAAHGTAPAVARDAGCDRGCPDCACNGTDIPKDMPK